jgi:sarcosine oxidase subunit gamma
MPELVPLAVAGIDLATGTEPHTGTVNGLPVTLSPAAAHLRLSLRARNADLLAAALGSSMPDAIGTHDDGIARLGPDEWYAVLPAGTAMPAETGGQMSVVDVSARALGFTLEGPGAVAALSRGCPLDLARFTPGRATRTLFETVEVQIWMIAPDHFHVEVWRSFAPWLWHSIAQGVV